MDGPLALLPPDLIPKLANQILTDVRFRSDFTDEKVMFTGSELADILMGKPSPPGKVSKALKFARPTIIINSPALGKRVWAPYGESNPNEPSLWKGRINLIIGAAVLAIFGIGFATGRLTGGK